MGLGVIARFFVSNPALHGKRFLVFHGPENGLGGLKCHVSSVGFLHQCFCLAPPDANSVF
jgi:hypothetical protein